MKALVITDVQNDFLPGGALAAPDGHAVIPIINRLMPLFPVVTATQDWHPPDHGSFASNHPGKKEGDVIDLDGLEQILWPDHCVQKTHGAELAGDLDRKSIQRIFYKATNPRIDSYSTFFDNGHRQSTGLGDYLKERGVTEVYLCGIATDYCVKYSALDAVKLGFDTYLITDACRGIDLEPGDVDRALDEMKRAGVRFVESGSLMGNAAEAPAREG